MEYKLSELFDLQMGKTPDRNNRAFWENGDIDWISIADLSKSEKYIKNTKETITEAALIETGIKEIPQNTVIMSFKLSIGKVAITPKRMFSNEAIMAFIDKHAIEILPEYLFYLLKHKNWEDGTNKAVMGKTLNKATLSNVKIRVHGVEKQKAIVKKLNLVWSIIDKKQKELEYMDLLIRARFVELFGDPIKNDKVWPVCSVENLCVDIYGGGTPSKSHPEYYENGDIPWISSKDMKTEILYDSQIHINALGVENSTARIVPINSIIMVIRSGILKHTLPVAINAVPITVNQDLKVFIPGNQIDPRFMAVQFKLIEKDILSGVRAVTADNIEFNSLKQRKLIVPDLELQKRFVLFVKQIDKSKVA